MEARAEHWLRGHVPHLHLAHAGERRPERILAAGIGAGLAGAVGLAVPVVVYDWAKAGHAALELPQAATAWLFGLDHFEQNGYRWWPIVIGAALLLAYVTAHGVAFALSTERPRTYAGALAGGLALGFVAWLLFWYTVLSIARDGAPFRASTLPGSSVAPNWVWILGFLALGVAAGLTHRAMRRPPSGPAS